MKFTTFLFIALAATAVVVRADDDEASGEEAVGTVRVPLRARAVVPCKRK